MTLKLSSLDEGGVVAIVHCVGDQAATEIVHLLHGQGASNIDVLGNWVVQG